ncbi:hypothetical protein GC176_25325 [bacterium]|nr:hypothetical protein [bacterium]
MKFAGATAGIPEDVRREMRRVTSAVCVVLVVVVCVFAESPAMAQRFARRWVYTHPGFDLRRDDQTKELISLIQRAGQAGYNGMCVGTKRLMLLSFRQPEALYENIGRVRQAAEKANVELIPRVMGINGYSNELLSNDPNLAAALPVRDCIFEVHDGRAVHVRSANLLPAGDIESFSKPNRADGWDFIDLPGKASFEDREVRHSGNASLRFQHFETASEHGNCRLFRRLQLKPWHQYHVRVWIKTENVVRPDSLGIHVHGNVSEKRRLNLQKRTIGVRATQGWTEHQAVFNTLDNREIWLYVGGWQPGCGTIWIDDVSLHEVAGINLLRRDGCPVRVVSEDGSQQFEEGRDFERWEYPQMGRVRWPGQYEVTHPEPPIVLAKDSRIRNGQRLKVSYFHAQHPLNDGMCVCLSHDDVFRYLEQHLEIVRKLYRPKTYLMVQDEIRLAGWCELCDQPGTTTAQVLARCSHRCTETIRRLDPDAAIMTWSDMFDPYHNAVDNYWLTRGTMKGSWEGLDQSTLIGNWNQGRSRQSLKFFASRGHRQVIATYYDRGNWQQIVADWLAAAEDVPGIDGIMYTTWSNNYRHLEDFIQYVNAAAP